MKLKNIKEMNQKERVNLYKSATAKGMIHYYAGSLFLAGKVAYFEDCAIHSSGIVFVPTNRTAIHQGKAKSEQTVWEIA